MPRGIVGVAVRGAGLVELLAAVWRRGSGGVLLLLPSYAPWRIGNVELCLLPSLFSSSPSAFLCFLELAAVALDWGKVEGL